MKIKKEKKYKNTKEDLDKYSISDLKFHVVCLEQDLNIEYKSKHLYGCLEDIMENFRERDKREIDAKVMATTKEDKYLVTLEFKLMKPGKNEYDDTLPKISELVYGDFSSSIPCLSF